MCLSVSSCVFQFDVGDWRALCQWESRRSRMLKRTLVCKHARRCHVGAETNAVPSHSARPSRLCWRVRARSCCSVGVSVRAPSGLDCAKTWSPVTVAAQAHTCRFTESAHACEIQFQARSNFARKLRLPSRLACPSPLGVAKLRMLERMFECKNARKCHVAETIKVLCLRGSLPVCMLLVWDTFW